MLLDGNGAEAVDIFGSTPPEAEPAPEADEDEEEDKDKGGAGADDKGGEDDEDEDDDDGEDEIDLDKETDPEKLRLAAKKFAEASKNKSQSIKDLRRKRRETVIQTNVKTKEFTPIYPASDLVLVKDLPKEKQDEMSDTEKRLHDDNVKTKTLFNDDAKRRFDEEQKNAGDGINVDVVLDDELEDLAKDMALEMAGGNKKIANEIIKNFNKFNNTGLTEAQLMENLTAAKKLATGFKPAQEQNHGKGKPAKKSGSDAFGNDAIVNSLSSTGTKEPIAL